LKTQPTMTHRPHRTRPTRLAGFLLGLALAAFATHDAPAQSLRFPSDYAGEVGELLRQGHELEIDRRWGDALSHYEDAVRRHPNDRSLQLRFDHARLHYDLARRYGDRSYRDLLAALSLGEALDVYSEVLLKIQAHHVETPNWKAFVEHGTNAFEAALAEPAFLEYHAARLDSAAVDAFRRELRRVLGPRVIQSRSDARSAAALAATLAQSRLGIPPHAVVLEYACGASSCLDPYSAYLTPDQLRDVYSQIEGNFVGLGLELKADDGALLIVRVIPGSPAERSGIAARDRITHVDGRPTRDLSTDGAANLLQGPEGTTVDLTLRAPGSEPRQVRVRRARVEVPSVDDVRILQGGLGVGYLKITCFQKTTTADLEAALWSLHRSGMRSLIVDLRNNPGGLLLSAVEAADKFIDRGIIVSTRGRSAEEDFTYSAHDVGTWRMPLIVIIDQDSASAAEIFAGAIRDHRRGTIVGVRSYGKGSVQGIFPLAATRAGIRLTTSKFYSPSGHPYNRVGVEPDIEVRRVLRPVDGSVAPSDPQDDDPVLTAALQAAQQLGSPR